jgi:hypothetical protein
MDHNKVVLHSDFHVNVASETDASRTHGPARRTSRGLLLRKGVWLIEGEAPFAFWNAVDPSLGRTHALRSRIVQKAGDLPSWQIPLDVYVSPCFARSRKQMERFTVVRNTCSKGPSFTSYRAIP